MCGRYASVKDPGRLAVEFDAFDATGGDVGAADYNVAPTKDVLTVVQRHPRDAEGQRDSSRTERSIRLMRWGLVPKWAEDPSIGNRMINAKSETVTTKPAFRSAIRYYRCLLPVDGWYEWRRDSGTKQPYFMTSTDDSSLALAGLWATWRDPRAEGRSPLVSCSVLTAEAVGQLTDVHERMPLVLPNSAWSRWLDPDVEDVTGLLQPPAPGLVDGLELRPVSSEVNNVRNNRPELLDRIDVGSGSSGVTEQTALFES